MALQVQVHSLFDDISAAEEKRHQLSQKLSQAKQVLQASKEEEQLLKVTLSEKDAQLLHTGDQVLGLRQCLAHFVSELSKLGPSVQRGVEMEAGSLYCVSTDAVNRLKSLADNGNIER